jgi:outer membrane immunogenic protein
MGGMRRYLLATVSAVALSTSAMAADIPARMPVKAPPPVMAGPSWAGFYIGLNAGVAWNHASFTDLGALSGAVFAFPIGTEFWSPDKAGFTGGGQIGHNLQSGNLVYGIEADVNFVGNKTSATIPGVFANSVTATTKLDWMATVRGRLGVTMSPTLIYVTGGWAVAHFEDTWVASLAPGVIGSVEKVRSGWTVGGGVEHMFARNWTVKIEALYADFGSWTGGLAAIGQVYRSRFEHEVVTVRGGLNYRW